MRGAMREVLEIGLAGEERIQIGFLKDGSGVSMARAAAQSGAYGATGS